MFYRIPISEAEKKESSEPFIPFIPHLQDLKKRGERRRGGLADNWRREVGGEGVGIGEWGESIYIIVNCYQEL